MIRCRCQRRNNATTRSTLYTVNPSIKDSNDHECFYPNPTYRDVQPNDNNISPKQGDDIHTSLNPTFEDEDKIMNNDHEFSVPLN